ncbi:hypothetical protein CUJ86_01610 [Methanofollis fontis]|uniref:Uncharacterized protein n=1 Tax=Methanofollis fontis TaxID=2052832 RepID=A0A483CUZ4_9EURY|nr:hypothetical protein CUJ86_01610 [Methanofollis fontis]
MFLLADKYSGIEENGSPWNWGSINVLETIRRVFGLFSVKSFAIVIKQLVINTLYETFPVFLIWLGVFGISVIISIFSGSVYFWPNQYFFEVVASFGIVLGVFQYYLKRHEEKIATKITLFSQKISAIMREELSFEKFYSSLAEINGGKEIKTWIDRQIDPKMHFAEILKLMAENPDLGKRIFGRRSRSTVSFNFPVSYANSDNKLDELEMYAVGDSMQRKLQKIYDSFFEDEQIVDTIIGKIRDEIDIQEFGYLCLGNINILQEVFPQLINRKLKNAVESFCFPREYTNGSEVFLSFRKRREILEGKVTQKLMDEIMGCL